LMAAEIGDPVKLTLDAVARSRYRNGIDLRREPGQKSGNN